MDLGLVPGVELDHLGVAAALEVEHAGVAPAVLVVADQGPLRVRRQRGLAGPGQAEEQRDVAALADIGRAVHREHALLGQEIVEHAEDRLLDLAGVARAADQELARDQVEHDRSRRVGAVGLRVGAQARQLQDREVGLEVRERLPGRRPEHVAREQAVPGGLGDHPDLKTVGRIGTGVEILNVQLAPERVGAGLGPEPRRGIRRHRLVDLAPVDLGLHLGPCDDEPVARRPAGVPSGRSTEGAAGHEVTLGAGDRELHQGRRRQIPANAPDPLEAELVEPVTADDRTGLLHDVCLPWRDPRDRHASAGFALSRHPARGPERGHQDTALSRERTARVRRTGPAPTSRSRVPGAARVTLRTMRRAPAAGSCAASVVIGRGRRWHGKDQPGARQEIIRCNLL